MVFAFATLVPFVMLMVDTNEGMAQREAAALEQAGSAARVVAVEAQERLERAQAAARTVERMSSFWDQPGERDGLLQALLEAEPSFSLLEYLPAGAEVPASAARTPETATSDDGPGWSAADPVPPLIAVGRLRTLADGSIAVPVSIPVRDVRSSTHAGTLVVGLSLSQLRAVWSAFPLELEKSSTVTIVDSRQGRILATDDPGLAQGGFPTASVLGEMQQHPLAAPHLSADGQRLLAWQSVGSVPWVVLVETPRSSIVASVLGSVAPRVAARTLTLLIAAGTLLMFWQRVSRQLRQIRRAATRWSSGDWSHRVGLPGCDELSHLGQAFDRMADELQAAAERIAAQDAERNHVLGRRETLLRLARDLAAEQSPERLLDDLLRESVNLLDADDAGIAQWDAGRGVLTQTHSFLPSTRNGAVLDLERSACGQAATMQRTVIIHDYQRIVGHATPGGRAGAQATVAVPLSHEGKRLGAISVSTYTPERRFDEQDGENLELLAGIATSALVGRQQARLEGVLLAVRTLEHELNNKLSLTRGYAELLLASPLLPEELQGAAHEAVRGADEASRLMDGLRRLTAIEEHDWGTLGSTIDIARSSLRQPTAGESDRAGDDERRDAA